MTRVLIGHTGFVGGVLAAARPFDVRVNRANLEVLAGLDADEVVCAGLPAAKWIANREPDADAANMRTLMTALSGMRARRFTLISTIDVYPQTTGLDESFDCSGAANHAYGSHRLQFEQFVRERFPNAIIARLPALFGTGLRKNVLYDLLHDNCLDAINPDSSFQWYPLDRLDADLRLLETHEARLVNLFTEPVPTRAFLSRFFPGKAVGSRCAGPVHYDLRTRHAALFGAEGHYMMNRDAVLEAMGRFIASERG